MGIPLELIVDGPTRPGGDAFPEYVAMTCRVHLMSGWADVLPDRAKACEKRLRATCIANAEHVSFAPAIRLMAAISSKLSRPVRHRHRAYARAGSRRASTATLPGPR